MKSNFTIFKTLIALLFFVSGNEIANAQSGLSFNGTNEYVTFGSAAGLGSAAFTLECWFYKSGTGIGTSTGTGGILSGIPLIAKGRSEADGSNLDMNYFLGINTATNVLCADFEEATGQASPGLNHPVNGITTLCNNVWYHAAATYDGATWKIYLNGMLEATLAVNRLPQSASIQFASIASALNSTGAASGYFNGKMDEVRIWNYARTQTDIQNTISLQIATATGLTGRYGLNENTGTVATNSGSAGTAVNGALKNTPVWIPGSTFTALNSNSSLQFGGTNSYATFGNNSALGLSQFTLECWFRKEGTGTDVSSGTGGITAKPLITKGRNETDGTNKDMNYFLGINASNNKLCADFEEGTGQPSPGLNHPVYGTTTIQDNVWYHASATYDGTTWKLYLNGMLEASLIVGRLPQSASIQHAAIASALTSKGSASGFFNGRIDEARIWNYSKSQPEIQSAINTQITTATPGLVSRWGMNDKCATTISGVGATTINGTIIGSDWNWNSGAPFNIGLTCDVPITLSTAAVTSTSATLNWNAIPAAVSYNIQYRIVGTVNWTAETSTTNTKSINTLVPESNYEWQVQSICSSGSSGFSATNTFNTVSSCTVPSNLSSASVTANGAQLNWTGSAGGTGYNIQYRITGTSTWTTAFSAATSIALTGLTSSSSYEWQVQSICSSEISSWSISQSFNTTTEVAFTDALVATNGVWKYLDNGTNQGTAWNTSSFDDASWASGAAQLGYGDGDEATVVGYGPSATSKYITTYFRKSFTVSNPASYNFLKMQLMRDDGAVVYINGVEVFRSNMPTGTVTYTTVAAVAVAGTDESAYYLADLNTASLVSGTNVIAVEIHQNLGTSSDISFALKLDAGFAAQSSVAVVRGAYLNSVSPSGIIVRWRTDIATDSKVSFGTVLGTYTSSATNAAVTTEHIVELSGLTSNTKYYYQIGSNSTVLQGDAENYFTTSAAAGSTTPVRIWALGDFGAGTTIESQVRDAYLNYTGSTYTNLFIWLGDNAYETGTDAEYQTNVFGYFGNQFKKFPVMPSPGNHDYANIGYQSAAALTTNWPYFDIFNMPYAAESGGIASGTEKYYSYNYANIHFIALDSYGALNNSSSPMYQWLVSDLAANTQRWTIVYFHHAPYTKGSHNSDTEAELIAMRQNINPLLEQYHVDLVVGGHSHVNERSYLIKGHYGLANTFTSAMKVSTATNAFTKMPPYDGTVYVVAGTGGKTPGAVQTGWPMPCMYYSNNTLSCSVVLDINGDNLSCKFIASNGSIPDQFTITKTGSAKYSDGDSESLSGLTVFPNPIDDEFTVFYELTKAGNVNLKLMDMTGRVIEASEHTVDQKAGSHQMNFNTNEWHLSSGIYLLRISVNEKQYMRKVVIE